MPRKRKTTVRARGLGVELKELRTRTGISTTKVGELLGWSASTVSRIETGNRGVTSEEVAAMMVVYKVHAKERERLLNLARQADQPGWWESGDPGLPSQLTSLIGFEAQAVRITDMRLAYVPGLLQTAEYTRALMYARDLTGQVAETRVATRLGRQAILTSPDPPKYRAFIDEAVLRRSLGGARVMAEQLTHILKAAQRPNITVQVLPFEKGDHRGLNDSFMILEFQKARTIVHLENKTSGLFLDEPTDTDAYLRDAVSLEESALGPANSADFLAEYASYYEEQ